MAKQKPQKIKPGEALQVLANEVQQLKVMCQGLMKEHLGFKAGMQDFAAVFDSYINFNGDTEKFMKHLDELIAKQKEKEKEQKGDSKADEKPDGKNMEKNKSDKG
tara:strand:- start:347 stop:661 length:315 start_codon:yes stop_codon:yes gene_type:complete